MSAVIKNYSCKNFMAHKHLCLNNTMIDCKFCDVCHKCHEI